MPTCGELLGISGVPAHGHEHRPLHLHGVLDTVELADQLDTDALVAPVFRLDHGRLPIADQDQVGAAVGSPAAADLPDAVAMTAEGVSDHFFKLLPGERGEISTRCRRRRRARPITSTSAASAICSCRSS
jgi:hypothetical protein